MFCEIKNDPQVEFGLFLFELEEKILNDVCRYTLVVRTDICIRGTHFTKTHNMDVTDATPSHFEQWLHQFSSDIDEYLHTVYQEHIINLNSEFITCFDTSPKSKIDAKVIS